MLVRVMTLHFDAGLGGFDDTAAVRFVSRDPVLGDVDETWCRKDGHLIELSVSAPDRELQDAWLRDLTAHLSTEDTLLP